MKKITTVMLGVLYLLMAVNSYSEQAITDLPEQEEDFIKIISLEPRAPVREGEDTVFRIELEYELFSYEQGQVMVGFNTHSSNSYRMNSSDSVIVERERNLLIIESSAIPKKWDEQKAFFVYVNLSKYPHEEIWSPLASDKKTIEVVAKAPNKLSEARKWAIALTGIMTEVNNDTHFTLNSDIMNEQNRKDYTNMLSRDWGIKSREDLLMTIDRMEKNGHANSLENIKSIIGELSGDDFSIFQIYNKYRLSQKQYNYLKFTLANFSLFKNRSILVWDYGRIIALCRWGYDCGYLTKEEAWEKIMYYAKKIQPMYSSWADYGFDYYMGRVFWASGFGKELEYLLQTEQVYKKLVSGNGYWSSLEWSTNLNE